MKKFRIEFINVGRNDFCLIEEKEFNTIEEAGQYAYEVADSKLLSSNTSMELSKEKNVYIVWAGMRPVGKIKIERVIG